MPFKGMVWILWASVNITRDLMNMGAPGWHEYCGLLWNSQKRLTIISVPFKNEFTHVVKIQLSQINICTVIGRGCVSSLRSAMAMRVPY